MGGLALTGTSSLARAVARLRRRPWLIAAVILAVALAVTFLAWRRPLAPPRWPSARTSVDTLTQAPARWLGRNLEVEGYFDAGTFRSSFGSCTFTLREGWATLRVRAFPCLGMSDLPHQRLVYAYGELEAEGGGYVLEAGAVLWSGEVDSVRYFPPETTGVTVRDIEAAAPRFREELRVRAQQPDTAAPRDVKQLERGFFHGCVLRFDGSVACWHNHQYEPESSEKPSGLTEVRGVPALVSIRLAIEIACGLDAGGDVYCWDAPRSTVSDSFTPRETRRVELPPARSVELTATGGRAVLRDGRVASFGHRFEVERIDDWGLPGLESTSGGCAVGEKLVRCGPGVVFPREEVSSVTDAFSLYSHACLLGRGAVRCRGSNWFAELGIEHHARAERQVDEWVRLTLAEQAVQVAVGGRHTCVALASGAVECLGGNEHGQASPFSARMSSATPLPVARFPLDHALSAGEDLSCMTSPAGRHECWGNCAALPELPKLTCTTWPARLEAPKR